MNIQFSHDHRKITGFIKVVLLGSFIGIRGGPARAMQFLGKKHKKSQKTSLGSTWCAQRGRFAKLAPDRGRK